MSSASRPRWTQQLRMIHEMRNNPTLRTQLLQAANNDPKLANRLAIALTNNKLLNTFIMNDKKLKDALRNFKRLLEKKTENQLTLPPRADTVQGLLFEIMNGGTNSPLFNREVDAQSQSIEQQNVILDEEQHKENDQEKEAQSKSFTSEHPELTLTAGASALAVFDERIDVEKATQEILEDKGIKKEENKFTSELANKLILKPQPGFQQESLEPMEEGPTPFKTTPRPEPAPQ